MGWDKGRYYTRSKKVNGRVGSEYVGSGELAKLAAQVDAISRDRRDAEREVRRVEKAELEAFDTPLNELNDLADLLARAALVAAGFRQHKRGEWRKRRGNRKSAEHDCSDRSEGAAQDPGAGAQGG